MSASTRVTRQQLKERNAKMAESLDVQATNIASDIEDFFDTYDLDALTEDFEIQQYVDKLSDIKRDFRRICAQLKKVEGENYAANYPGNDASLADLSEKFKTAYQKLSDLKRASNKEEAKMIELVEQNEKLALQERLKVQKDEEKRVLDCAENLKFEIEIRGKAIDKKCSVVLSDLTGYEVLDIKKCEEKYYTEHRELIDKVSSFEKFVMPCGASADKIRQEVVHVRDKSTTTLDTFIKSLTDHIKTNDISEEKLKNSSVLDIKLQKFKGHQSDMDVYTFRAEFKKLVEPFVQKCLWADRLKLNYLEGPAYNLVSKSNDIDEIWKKLFDVFGDTRLMLQNKLLSLDKFCLEKIRDDEKIAFTISNLLNTMADLSRLAKQFNLEAELYHGGGVIKILDVIGNQRERKFIKSISGEKLGDPEKWQRLIKFLENERREKEAFVLNTKVRKSMNLERSERDKDKDKKNDREKKDNSTFNSETKVPTAKCYICSKEEDHVVSYDSSKKPYVEYVACKDFVDKTPKQRDKLLFKKRFCSKCLKPGVKWNASHDCDKQFICNQKFVKDDVEKTCSKHVLVCGFHSDKQSNKDLLALYKQKIIEPHGKFFDFSKNVSLSCFSESYPAGNGSEGSEEGSIFAFQTISISGLLGNIFYDNGCGDLVVSKKFVDLLMQIGRAELVIPGEMVLRGVNDQTSVAKHGVYKIKLPLKNGGNAEMTGLCVDAITIPFPKYPLCAVEQSIRDYVSTFDKDLLEKLPRLPNEVGGEVHVMMGKQYLKHFPNEVVQLDSGLTLYNSKFESADGTTGVICGPHPEFTKVERSSGFFASRAKMSYLSQEVRNYFDLSDLKSGLTPLDGEKVFHDPELEGMVPQNHCTGCIVGDSHPKPAFLSKCVGCGFEFNTSTGESGAGLVYGNTRTPKNWKMFDESQNSGTNISYRCPDCRNCSDCKRGALVEEINLKDECDQHLINKSVEVNLENNTCSASLPFTSEPDEKLSNNSGAAKKVYFSQVKKLSKNEQDRLSVIAGEGKLQRLGYVDYLENLSEPDQKMILEGKVQYYIAWRIAWSKSLTTPARPVFDMTMKPPEGCAMNDIMAKGVNGMNNLVEILIRWRIKPYAYHTDISQFYNRVNLVKEHWRYQLYWWEENLDPTKPAKTKVIKTVIYGGKASGNQAERALRMTADLCKETYPMAHRIVHEDCYVDDCISGEFTEEGRDAAVEQFRLCLGKGGFSLKGITLSGEDPDVNLSSDGKSIGTGGLKYFPKGDFIMLNIGDLNFARKVRGRKVGNKTDIPKDLTMRNCVSRVGEIFDPLGKVAPIVAKFKLSISHLHRSGLKWDDVLPDNLRNIWVSHFEMIEELRTLKYRRAVVPVDAKNLDIMTIDTGDASGELACSAIYARFEKKNGTFSCQLVMARTKVVPVDTTIPRAELMASVMNATTAHIVGKAFGEHLKDSIKLTDSTTALYWICSEDITLKSWTRSRVVEINRLSEKSKWRYVDTSNMIADLGTRSGAQVSDVDDDSCWTNGYPWMSGPINDFPVHTVDEVKYKMSPQDIAEANKEVMVVKTFHNRRSAEVDCVSDRQIKLRYQHSSYLIDPNRFRLRKVVRIMALVLKFIRNIRVKLGKAMNSVIHTHVSPNEFPKIFNEFPKMVSNSEDKYIVTTGSQTGAGSAPAGKVIEISEDLLKCAFLYFVVKASNEVKKFLDKSKYEHFTKEIDGILYYSGRILTDHKFGGYPDLCEAAIDLCQTTFCVPVMDQLSPVAISIAFEVHWHHPDVRHRGAEIIWRQMERVAHIIGGRKLAVSLKEGCKRCRALEKKAIEVAMGPIQEANLCIAPAFYSAQIDIFGPFKAYSPANKRASIKAWFLIVVCTTTCATDIRVLEDYSTESVVFAISRFSCRFGFPKHVFPDPGSQLLKACKDLQFSFIDTKQQLSVEHGIEFSPSPVGAHYMHGKVERKIREVKKSVVIHVENERLSLLRWETLMLQIANSLNNMPIGLKNKTSDLDKLDLVTPNRLLIGRNNDRSPSGTLSLCPDHGKMLQQNIDIFKAWFKEWIISYLPQLMERPKWFTSGKEIHVGDIVLFLKSEKEFDLQYQYGRVSNVHEGKDGIIRRVDVEYKNASESGWAKRTTQRGVRDLVIVYPIDELDDYERLAKLVDN